MLLPFNSFFLLFLPILGLAKAQDDIGCFVSGECKNAHNVDIELAADPSSCLEFCQSTSGCLFWTHYSNNGACLAFSDCDNFDPSGCTDCVSGEVGCDDQAPPTSDNRCMSIGSCTAGTNLGLSIENSLEDCFTRCQAEPGCSHFNYGYDESDRTCVLMNGCSGGIDSNSCQECFTGTINGCPVPKTKLLVLGGFTAPGNPTAEAHMYDVLTTGNCPNDAGSFLYAVSAAVSFTVNHIPWVCGGYRADSKLPSATCSALVRSSNTWYPYKDMGEEREGAFTVTLDDGTVWITGGLCADCATSELVTSESSVMEGPDLSRKSFQHCVAKSGEDEYLIIGGTDYNTRVDLYNFASDGWEILTALPSSYEQHGCGSIKTADGGYKVVVAGGRFAGDSVCIIDPEQNYACIEGPPLPAPLAYTASVQFLDSFLLVGGRDTSTDLNQNVVYYFDQDKLTSNMVKGSDGNSTKVFTGQPWKEMPLRLSKSVYEHTVAVLSDSEAQCDN